MRGVEIRGKARDPIEFLAVGHLAVDVREGERVLGGAAAYSALTALRLGLSAAIVTAVGDDFDLFESLGDAEVHFHREGQSTSFENRYRGARRDQRLLGRSRPLVEKDLEAAIPRLASNAIVFYCPLAREIEMPLERKTPDGLSAVAPQGFFRRWDDEGRVSKTDWILATPVDVVSLSSEDAPDVDRFVAGARKKARVVAVTEGVRGARLFHGGIEERIPAWVREEVDPTGAGDVFAAALLVALHEGESEKRAAEFACCAASFAVERPGVLGVPPSRADVEARLREYRRGA